MIMYKTRCGVRKRYPIKNWKKIKGQQDSWENTKTYSGVSIEKLGDGYVVEERYITRLNRHVRKPLSKIVSKNKAKKIAYKYMREHEDFR